MNCRKELPRYERIRTLRYGDGVAALPQGAGASPLRELQASISSLEALRLGPSIPTELSHELSHHQSNPKAIPHSPTRDKHHCVSLSPSEAEIERRGWRRRGRERLAGEDDTERQCRMKIHLLIECGHEIVEPDVSPESNSSMMQHALKSHRDRSVSVALSPEHISQVVHKTMMHLLPRVQTMRFLCARVP